MAIVVALAVVYAAITAATCDCLLRRSTVEIHPVIASHVDLAWPL
jgi:hypothetical protein